MFKMWTGGYVISCFHDDWLDTKWKSFAPPTKIGALYKEIFFLFYHDIYKVSASILIDVRLKQQYSRYLEFFILSMSLLDVDSFTRAQSSIHCERWKGFISCAWI